MPGARSFGLALLLIGAACVQSPVSQAPRPLKPEDGPRASIHVTYMGGLLNRSVEAYFRSEQGAYVLVGHLGGDGRIRVLYPGTPDESGYVRGKKMYRTTRAPAYYDGIPSLFSFAVSPFRGLGAMHDSYDGRGHGYVFIVASRTPLRYGLLDDYAGWAEWEVEDYQRSHDPRYAVRTFADLVAGGANYTLKFASSLMTTSYDTYASRAWDCTLLSSLSLLGHSAWSGWNPYVLGYRFSPARYCAGTFPTFSYASAGYTRPVVRVPVPGTGDPAPSLDRPGRRGFSGRTAAPERDASLTRIARTGPDTWDRSPAPRTSPRYGDRGRRAEASASAAERRSRAWDTERTSSPRSSREGRSSSAGRSGESPSTQSSGASSRSSGSSSGASSSSGSRSGSQPASSPSERRRPDSR
ncbi:MAG TPA: hypothetical protein VFZ21_21155 [Gemmatimonadaceae bacterium]|nr:hypothetical protein [Gemmatimonadaceae bacterium]